MTTRGSTGGRSAGAARTHVSAAGLRARGWTDGIVRRLLGVPDRLGPDPRFRSAPWTRMYRVERVEAVERSAEFRSAAAFAARRSGAVRKAADRRGRESLDRRRREAVHRRREVLGRILAQPIDVPRMETGKLARRAVEHRESVEHRVRPAAEDTDRASLDHWMVDFLRHRLSHYDELLEGLPRRGGQLGRSRAVALLRRRIYAAIAEAYPGLAEECERQARDQRLGPPPAGERARHARQSGQDHPLSD
ncbi:hypothetical protein [Streptomyces sp. NPDC050704]|uniref:hypothetical protein n=1 Tax=Streptomyces sp. NPDC050704 TaxID=3157219 RepID=UPI003424126B